MELSFAVLMLFFQILPPSRKIGQKEGLTKVGLSPNLALIAIMTPLK